MVLDTLVDVAASSIVIVPNVATATYAYIFLGSLVSDALFSRWARLRGATSRGLDLHTSLSGWVTLEPCGTLTRKLSWLVAADGAITTGVIDTLIDICTSKYTNGVSRVPLVAHTLGLTIDQFTPGVGSTAHVLTRIWGQTKVLLSSQRVCFLSTLQNSPLSIMSRTTV